MSGEIQRCSHFFKVGIHPRSLSPIHPVFFKVGVHPRRLGSFHPTRLNSGDFD